MKGQNANHIRQAVSALSTRCRSSRRLRKARRRALDKRSRSLSEGRGAKQIAQLQATIKDLEGKLLRALADQENSRKPSQRDAEAAVKFAASAVAADLHATLDNLQFALDAAAEGRAASEPSMKHIAQGCRAIARSLLSAMQKHGIERIAPLGQPFDPNLHAAFAEVECSDTLTGTGADVLEPGYLHYDRLLPPAMGNVAKSGPANTPPETPWAGQGSPPCLQQGARFGVETVRAN
jgi:molecular chaperone GrpE